MYYIHLNRHHGFSLMYNHEQKRFDERIIVTNTTGELEVIDALSTQHTFNTKENAYTFYEEALNLLKKQGLKDYELTIKIV